MGAYTDRARRAAHKLRLVNERRPPASVISIGKEGERKK